jgi:lipopolysaccharide/colanic/teichoic acid biosynthesis glycosyltransferase
MKRLVDIIVSLVGILVLSPLFAVLAILIKLGSPGPVFYRGVRVGRHGRLFRIFKFRSMVPEAERLGGSNTSDADARITPIGRILRKYKLDELPQLLNVLLGDMSLVGPRPEVPKYVDLYDAEGQALLSTRPGITDWASIWNSDEGAFLAHYEDPDFAYEQFIRPTKIQLQLVYVRHHSLWIDCKILAYTLLRLAHYGWLPPELRGYPSLSMGPQPNEPEKNQATSLRGQGS